MSHVKYVAHQMQRQYTTTEIHIALVVKTLRHKIITITCPPMFNSQDQPKGCINETSVKQPVNTTKSTGTENTYASLITAVTEHFKDLKQKQN